jgi:hypothetical protein
MPICSECGEECTPVEIDEGFGLTEAWGITRDDVRLVLVSDCCEAEFEDEAKARREMIDID